MKNTKLNKTQQQVITNLAATLVPTLEGEWHPIDGVMPRMAKFTSTDQSRAALLDVNLGANPSTGEWQATATDGSQLLRTAITTKAPAGIDYRLPAEAFKLHSKRSTPLALFACADNGQRKLALPVKDQWAVFHCPDYGTFPNCNTVIPDRSVFNAVIKVHYDPESELWGRGFNLQYDGERLSVAIQFDKQPVRLPKSFAYDIFTLSDHSSPFHVGINGPLLAKALAAGITEFKVHGEPHGNATTDPIMGTVTDGVHLLMPMRLI